MAITIFLTRRVLSLASTCGRREVEVPVRASQSRYRLSAALAYTTSSIKQPPYQNSSLTPIFTPNPTQAQIFSSYNILRPVTNCWFSTDAEEEARPWTDIGTQELLDMLDDDDIQLIDVREPEELVESGCIPTSINVPLGEVEEAFKLSPQLFFDKYGGPMPTKEDTNIVFHCRAGVRSRTAMTAVHQLGYSKARHYYPGYLGWQEHFESQ